MLLFTNQFFIALPSIGFFWGIAYLLMIKRKKIKVRTWVALAHLVGTTVILALGVSPGSQATDGESSNLVLAALLLSVISCTILRWQEQKYQAKLKPESSKND